MTTSVYFVVLPGVLLLDLAGAAEAMRLANHFGADYALHFVGTNDEPSSSVGVSLSRVDALPEALPTGTLVVLVGITRKTMDERGEASRAVIAWLNRIWRNDLRLMTICSGALLAGAAGLLDGKHCTTHHSLVDRLRGLAPKAIVAENRVFVIDGQIATSAGVTTGLDLALEIIARDVNPKAALDVAREMVVWLRRDSASPQLSPFLSHRNHLHPAVHRAQDAIASDPARDWSLDELAQVACVSSRHLTRLFKTHAGIGPVDYRQRIQLAQVEPLLARQDCSLERIAETAGFGSARDLRRVWQKHHGRALQRTVS
jgi:transcriptional regulator GlxA family with amidase domain